MTKNKAPMTPEGALGTIGAWPGVGWARIAAVVRRQEVTVRGWSNPDTTGSVTFAHMLLLDSEFFGSGGGYRPFAAAFAAASDMEDARIAVDAGEIAAAAAIAAKESGDAFAASFDALRPGAPNSALLVLEKEEAEACEAHSRFLQRIRSALSRRARR